MDLDQLMLLKLGGGGGGGEIVQGSFQNPIDAPPATPTQYDDEFNTSTLDAKWQWLNQGGASASLSSGVCHIDFPGGGIACRGIVQAAPTSLDYTITTSIVNSTYWENYTKFGIILSESLTGKQTGLFIAHDAPISSWSPNKGILRESFSNPLTRANFAYNGTATQSKGYIKVRVYTSDSTIYYIDVNYSRNGNTWNTGLTNYQLDYIPKFIGIGGDNEYSNPSTVGYNWFRVVA